MKKTLFALLTGLFICLGITQIAHADDYLRIGMEAAYAPFNWTQEDDSNGAVKIDGTNQYANGYDVQIAKKVAAFKFFIILFSTSTIISVEHTPCGLYLYYI